MSDLNSKRLEKIRELLIDEQYDITDNPNILPLAKIPVLPLVGINDRIVLRFNGWSIILSNDGTYHWEAYDGG